MAAWRTRGILGALLILTAGYTALLAYLYLGQESLIFVGRKLPADHRFQFDVPFEELTIDVDDAELNALHFQQDTPHGLVFFLHGNGGNLASWTSNADYYERVNYDMFMFDYRGYGKSSGSIESEAQLHADVRRAWDAVAGRRAYARTVILGRSLGAALAARLAADVDADLVVLISPFTSMLAMADRQYPFVPSALVRYPLRNDLSIRSVREPIVFFHGDRDAVIPMSHSEELLRLAGAPARLVIVNGAGHNDLHRFPGYIEPLTEALLP